jgi:hypothetical protein
VAAEGISLSFKREEGAEGTVSGTNASNAVGVGPLGVSFAFFEGGSINPSSLQMYRSISLKGETNQLKEEQKELTNRGASHLHR